MSLTSFRRMQLTAYQFSRLREKTKHAARRGIVWYAPQRPRNPPERPPVPARSGDFFILPDLSNFVNEIQIKVLLILFFQEKDAYLNAM